MRNISYILSLSVMMLMVSEVFAASITIEWRSVRGSRGYVVEYRRGQSSRTSRKRVSDNRAVLNLPPSTYKVRVAGLNKFGKPGVWSDWLNVSVAASSSGVIRLGGGADKPKATEPKSMPIALLSRDAAPPPGETRMALAYARKAAANRIKKTEDVKPARKADQRKKKLEKAEQPDARDARRSNFWSFSTLLPGLPQLQRGDTGLGVLYMGLAGALTGFVVSRGASADSIASQPGNDPLLMSFLLNGQSQQSLFIAREMRADARAVYDARVEDQRLAAGLLALVYVWHLVDVAFWKPNHPVTARSGGSSRSYDVNIFADGEKSEGRRAEFRFSMRF